MLKKLLFKKLTTITMSLAIAAIPIIGMPSQSVQAKVLDKNLSIPKISANKITPFYNGNETQLLNATVTNSNYTYPISGMIYEYSFAVASVNTTLDVRGIPNGSSVIGSVYNQDLVYIYATYVDGSGVNWAFVKYMVTGTGNAKAGWVHARYLHFT